MCYNKFMKKSPKAVDAATQVRKTAALELQEFLTQKDIVIHQDVSNRDVKTVSDGSIIIARPVLRAEYKQ